VKVLIVDDHPIVASGLSALLSDADEFDILTARDAIEGREVFETAKPGVSLIDINLPGTSGFTFTKDLLEFDPSARILIFSMNDDPGVATEALDIGALGFVSKNDDPSLFLDALKAVAKGDIWLPADIAQKIAVHRACAPRRPQRLSSREVQILRHLSRGRSMSEVAGLLDVSYKTISTDCSTIRHKLEARTPVEMIRIAVERKLV
jgi:two-component system, NarL family, invasion response regulator UvrY